jgi:hypothetical protein
MISKCISSLLIIVAAYHNSSLWIRSTNTTDVVYSIIISLIVSFPHLVEKSKSLKHVFLFTLFQYILYLVASSLFRSDFIVFSLSELVIFPAGIGSFYLAAWLKERQAENAGISR